MVHPWVEVLVFSPPVSAKKSNKFDQTSQVFECPHYLWVSTLFTLLFPPPPKLWDRKPKATTKVTLRATKKTQKTSFLNNDRKLWWSQFCESLHPMVVKSTEYVQSHEFVIFHRYKLKSVKYCHLSVEYFTNHLLFPCHLLCKNSNLDIFINRQVVRSKIYLYASHHIHVSFLKTMCKYLPDQLWIPFTTNWLPYVTGFQSLKSILAVSHKASISISHLTISFAERWRDRLTIGRLVFRVLTSNSVK